MADTAVSKTVARKGVRVRVPHPAPNGFSGALRPVGRRCGCWLAGSLDRGERARVVRHGDADDARRAIRQRHRAVEGARCGGKDVGGAGGRGRGLTEVLLGLGDQLLLDRGVEGHGVRDDLIDLVDVGRTGDPEQQRDERKRGEHRGSAGKKNAKERDREAVAGDPRPAERRHRADQSDEAWDERDDRRVGQGH